MLMINVLIHTDLPEPVAPAISTCGIFAISETITLPEISLPTAKPMLSPPFLKALLSKRSRKNTVCFCLFGTSIPIADFPGIGASILISLAASASLISFASDNTFETLTPCSGLSS